MSTKIKMRHYFRFNQQSIQGKFMYLLGIAACLGIILTLNFWVIRDQQVQQQQLLEVWLPTREHIHTLSLNIRTGQLSPEVMNPAVDALTGLSDRWESERMLLFYEGLLTQLEALQQAAAAGESTQLQQLPEYAAIQKTLPRLLNEAEAQLQAIQQDSGAFLQKLQSIFIWEYIGYFLTGGIISALIALSVMGKIRRLKTQVVAITKGNLSEKIQLQDDEFYTMSHSLNQLIDNLKDITFFAGEVGRGNMDASLNAFDEDSELGRSLSEMRDSLKRVATEDKHRRWINEGIANFANILRKHNGNVEELSNAVVGELVKYVGALQGALFITHQDTDGMVLQMKGCYAYDRQKYLNKKIPVDSGLIGQTYLEKAPRYLREIPKDYDTITTGLGQGSPESIMMMPLLHEDRVEGVLELASMRQFEEHELEFLNRVTETLGAAVAGVRISEETRRLLEESQGVAEELRSQEEEMRQNMEEMQATQEEMARAQKELGNKETNLNAFINNTSDAIISVTRDYKVGLINDVLKKRYKGSQYEGIDVGSDIMTTLGAVAEEWKGYYDRAFAGEELSFTLKSSVRGEDSWRFYQISPIKTKTGEIVSVSVISRDVTPRVKMELKLKQTTAILAKISDLCATTYLALDEQLKVIITSKQLAKALPELTDSPRP
ncbi:MAG: GAF domain-containing protein, partial [Bacteroidetes bacterium]|nr:GAF domain-containing protein [Bacteroidota bacterium]